MKVTTLKQQIKKPPHQITELSLADLQRDLKKYQYHTELGDIGSIGKRDPQQRNYQILNILMVDTPLLRT